jgi:hypothetical protein
MGGNIQMGKFKVGDIVKVKDCDYAITHNVVGCKGEIVGLEAGEFDYKVRYHDHPTRKDFEDLLDEDEIFLFAENSQEKPISYTDTRFTTLTRKCKIIYNEPATIVILEDGSKGVAKCAEGDTYDRVMGFKIAFRRAVIKSMNKELRKLCS